MTRRKGADASMLRASITVPESRWAGASVISAIPYAHAVEAVDAAVAFAAIGCRVLLAAVTQGMITP